MSLKFALSRANLSASGLVGATITSAALSMDSPTEVACHSVFPAAQCTILVTTGAFKVLAVGSRCLRQIGAISYYPGDVNWSSAERQEATTLISCVHSPISQIVPAVIYSSTAAIKLVATMRRLHAVAAHGGLCTEIMLYGSTPVKRLFV
ncbi:uncharacterized protein PHACADRAFT_186923 [Phanerochaete carnosa HHB-10118-sp]|uniref:Uncharacterized protein n=1 Tax=Phanerochaete carnosa (strain HHB-10118-sp) TaxID=650164 RepID=K5VN78_PHACS|nr:uncharacterized protein PHACADRAFT_186923 [Phanerochaete carnosa HHB-10118-sp]EKM52893.1 hypothetical protein PHACADRAFT_186923 [Phanerochaete carnosa HHB-10118-sp]